MARPVHSADLTNAVRSARRIVDDAIQAPGGIDLDAEQADRLALRTVAFALVLRELLTYEYD